MDCTEYIITNKRFFKGPREEKLKSLEGLIKRKVKVISYCVRNYHKTVAFFFSFLFFFFGLACRILILRPETNPHPKWKQSPSHWNIKEFPKPNALKQNFIFNYVRQRFATDSAETISSLLRVVQLGSLICLGSQLG